MARALTCTFLSTLSLRRATQAGNVVNATIRISIHALLAESDSVSIIQSRLRSYFYPRSPCGERLAALATEQQTRAISIHALLAESDGGYAIDHIPVAKISIHALLAESDAQGPFHGGAVGIFLSTLSLRRATSVPGPAGQHCFDFYPRSPCGERQGMPL